MEQHHSGKDRNHITIVNQGIDYIFDHLFEKITVDDVADHCCFSRHYFNRLFKSVTGETLYGFIKRLRLETAAFKLFKFPQLSITDIAAQTGYSSSNFAVFFREHYGLSPSAFRRNPRLVPKPGYRETLRRIQELQKEVPVDLLTKMDKQISFEFLPDITLHYSRFKGNYRELTPVWEAFCREMESQCPGVRMEYYGISYDDPLIAGVANCLYDLCARLPEGEYARSGNFRTVPAGAYLCYRFDDHIRELAGAYNDLFAIWMPHRGYTMGVGLCLERYETGVNEDGRIIVDLCIPLS